MSIFEYSSIKNLDTKKILIYWKYIKKILKKLIYWKYTEKILKKYWKLHNLVSLYIVNFKMQYFVIHLSKFCNFSIIEKRKLRAFKRVQNCIIWISEWWNITFLSLQYIKILNYAIFSIFSVLRYIFSIYSQCIFSMSISF